MTTPRQLTIRAGLTTHTGTGTALPPMTPPDTITCGICGRVGTLQYAWATPGRWICTATTACYERARARIAAAAAGSAG